MKTRYVGDITDVEKAARKIFQVRKDHNSASICELVNTSNASVDWLVDSRRLSRENKLPPNSLLPRCVCRLRALSYMWSARISARQDTPANRYSVRPFNSFTAISFLRCHWQFLPEPRNQHPFSEQFFPVPRRTSHAVESSKTGYFRTDRLGQNLTSLRFTSSHCRRPNRLHQQCPQIWQRPCC